MVFEKQKHCRKYGVYNGKARQSLGATYGRANKTTERRERTNREAA